MSRAIINPKLLRWSVERSRASLEAVAKSASVTTNQLSLWQREVAEDAPTFRQAQNLARVLNIPFGYLFLSSPPKDKLPLPDLRRIRHAEYKSPTAEFRDLLSDILRKVDWYREHLEEEGAEPLEYIGRFSLRDSAEDVAEDIKQTLGISDSMRRSASNWEEFLRRFIVAAEERNILVFRSGIVGGNTHRTVSVEEVRGFAISDNVTPVIFLNGRDAKAAQIFSLAHELAHLWIGESGISNLDVGEVSLEQEHRIERQCNQVAAELLVPRAQFVRDWDGDASVADNVHRLVRRYRVSSIVILRRAFDLRKISQDQFVESYGEEVARWSVREGREEGAESGGNFYLSLFARNSSKLTAALVSDVREGKVLYRDASSLLGVKVRTLEAVAKRLGM